MSDQVMKKALKCPHCVYETTNWVMLKRHVEEIHLKCEYRKTTGKESMKKRVNAIHKNIKHQCSYCEFEGITKNALKCHIDRWHKKINYKCTDCDFETAYESCLTDHIRTHYIYGKVDHFRHTWHIKKTKQSSSATTQGNNWLPTSQDRTLGTTRESNFSSNIQLFLCPHCGKTFSKQRVLSAHKDFSHQFGCPHCNEAFSKQKKVNAHEETTRQLNCNF